MSIIDHFDRTLEPGFLHTIDPNAARRQLNMSLGLVIIFVVGAFGLAVTMGIAPLPSATPSLSTASYVQAPQTVHIRNASVARDVSGG